MTYKEHHLRTWLQEHNLLPINALENKAGIPKDTLWQFVKERRGFPDKHYEKIVEILTPYGFEELNQE